MKALEKDRTRRYDSAGDLALDLKRHLANEPVLARPASHLYRFRRSVRRNRITFAAAGAVAATLVAGSVISTWQAIRATHAEHEERQARQEAQEHAKSAVIEAAKSRQVATFMKDMLDGVQPSVALGRDTAMLREILDRTAERVGKDLTDQPAVEAELRETLGTTYSWLAEFSEAEAMQSSALRIRRTCLVPSTPTWQLRYANLVGFLEFREKILRLNCFCGKRSPCGANCWVRSTQTWQKSSSISAMS
jgi:hypothetical protein